MYEGPSPASVQVDEADTRVCIGLNEPNSDGELARDIEGQIKKAGRRLPPKDNKKYWPVVLYLSTRVKHPCDPKKTLTITRQMGVEPDEMAGVFAAVKAIDDFDYEVLFGNINGLLKDVKAADEVLTI